MHFFSKPTLVTNLSHVVGELQLNCSNQNSCISDPCKMRTACTQMCKGSETGSKNASIGRIQHQPIELSVIIEILQMWDAQYGSK